MSQAQGSRAGSRVAGASSTSRRVFWYPQLGVPGEPAFLYQPTGISFSEDGSVAIEHLHWSGWGTARATGVGLGEVDDCKPNCASGHRATAPATIKLTVLAELDGRLVYRCTSVTSSLAGIRGPDHCVGAARPVPETPSTGEGTGPSSGTPVPELAHTVVLTLVSGAVLVRLPGSTSWVRLEGSLSVPVGTDINASGGRVRVVVDEGSTETASAIVYGGWFIPQQDATPPYETHFVLSQPLSGCEESSASAAMILGSRPRTRHLWVHDSGGSFGTQGDYVSTTVEGTRWLTRDGCGNSSVEVAEGVVLVLDLLTGQTTEVSAGHHFEAAAQKPSTKLYSGHAFSIEYPAAWKLGNRERHESWGGTDTTIAVPGDPHALIRIDIRPKGGPRTPATAARPVIDSTSRTPGYRELVLGSAREYGLPALRWQFLVKEAGLAVRTEDDFIVNPATGETIAILTTAPAGQYQALAAAFEAARRSLKIK